MRWIRALNLEQWADTIASKTDLSELVGDLIRATAPDIRAMRFPSGDKGQVRGFDGNLETETAAFNVPQGRSYWEFGTDKKYKDKVQRDFEKRDGEVEPAEQANLTLVLVTPYTWDFSDPKGEGGKSIEDCVAKWKADSKWKDIRIIDGAQLEEWLAAAPAAATWHARYRLKLNPAVGVRSTEEFWAEFSGQFAPAITEDVLLCARGKHAEDLLQLLDGSPAETQFVADSLDEAAAFAVAAIRKAPPDLRLFLEAKTLVVDTIEAGRALGAKDGLILILRGEAGRSPSLFSADCSLIIALGRQQRGGAGIQLPRPTAQEMAKALMTMSLSENEALTLARGSGRSLTALARLRPSGHAEEPAWVKESGDALLPALLAGAWDQSNDKDKEILQKLAERNYREFDAGLRKHITATPEPAVELTGSVWTVRAPMDAFVRLGRLIGKTEAETFKDALLEVFGAPEPAPDPDEPIGFRRKGAAGHTEWLREGLAITLLMLAVWEDTAQVNLITETGQQFANRVVAALPGLRTDARLLSRLQRELPLLAEAAPDPLLSALESMLEGNGERIRLIFDESPGLITPTANHVGVLWALETLAWDPKYFRRAVLALAKLAAIDPGGKIANRPGASLGEIFTLWAPNTNAPQVQRLRVLDEIIEIAPNVSWVLLTRLLPSLHDVSSPTAKPRLREAGAGDREPITVGEYQAAQRAIIDRVIDRAGVDVERWREVIGHLTLFPPDQRERATAELESVIIGLEGKAREQLWKRLDHEVNRHIRFKQADWALPAIDLEPLRALAEKFAPVDVVDLAARLFDQWDAGISGDLNAASAMRAHAIKDLHRTEGAMGVMALSAKISQPHLLVQAIAEADLPKSDLEPVLDAAVAANGLNDFSFGLAGLHRNKLGVRRALDWLTDLAKRQALAPEVIARVFMTWPDTPSTWTEVSRWGSPIAEIYWRDRPPTYFRGAKENLLKAVRARMRQGRFAEALQSSLDRLAEVPSKLLLEMVSGVAPQMNADIRRMDVTMVGYYVTTALKELDQRLDVDVAEIARCELALFSLLEYSDRDLRIYEIMANTPEFYYELLSYVFVAKADVPPPGAPRLQPQPAAQRVAKLAYGLLSKFSLLPGSSGSDVDEDQLVAWVNQVRKLATIGDRSEVADSYVGRVLAHASPDNIDQAWPHRGVRAVIDRLKSDEVERGVMIERFNMRGVTMRQLTEGGDQERELARVYRQASDAAASWPRTSAMLAAIANRWEEDAKREDLEAEQRRLKM